MVIVFTLTNLFGFPTNIQFFHRMKDMTCQRVDWNIYQMFIPSLDPGKPLRSPERGPCWQSLSSLLVIIPKDPLILTFADKRWHASLILSLKWKTTFGLLKCFLLSLDEIYHHPFQNCYLHNFFSKQRPIFKIYKKTLSLAKTKFP